MKKNPNEKDKNVLNLILGKKTCIDCTSSKIFYYFGGLFFTLLLIGALLCLGINNLPLQLLIFIIVFLAIEQYMNRWREKNPVCPTEE